MRLRKYFTLSFNLAHNLFRASVWVVACLTPLTLLAQNYIIKPIAPLTPPSGYSSNIILSAINDHGEVVGTSLHSRRINTQLTYYWNRAILWKQDQTFNLGVLGSNSYGSTSYASDINNHSQIVGYSSAGIGIHPFIWEQGVLTDLADSQYPVVYANAINNNGVIVGDSSAAAYDMRHAYVYQNGHWSPLIGLYSGAVDINDAGQILGWAKLTDDEYGWWLFGDPDDPQFIWGDLLNSRMTALNSSGDAVGRFATGVYGESFAGWYHTGQLVRLDSSAHPHSAALGINDSGATVGYIANPSSHAVLWQNGQVIDLNTLIPPGAGWELTQAVDINNQGWIIGNGNLNGSPRGFVLIPIQPDINQDGCVDDADLLELLFQFGQNGAALSGDIDHNEVVDDSDLLLLLFHFGRGC